jgi:hypothetical protein
MIASQRLYFAFFRRVSIVILMDQALQQYVTLGLSVHAWLRHDSADYTESRPRPPLIPYVVPHCAHTETDEFRKEVEHAEKARENKEDRQIEGNSD